MQTEDQPAPLSPLMEQVVTEWEYKYATEYEMQELLNLLPNTSTHGDLGLQYPETILTPKKY